MSTRSASGTTFARPRPVRWTKRLPFPASGGPPASDDGPAESPEAALDKELSYDTLPDLASVADLEDPALESPGAAALATRLAGACSGLQVTLGRLLAALPQLERERRALRTELAALRDANDALRRHHAGTAPPPRPRPAPPPLGPRPLTAPSVAGYPAPNDISYSKEGVDPATIQVSRARIPGPVVARSPPFGVKFYFFERESQVVPRNPATLKTHLAATPDSSTRQYCIRERYYFFFFNSRTNRAMEVDLLARKRRLSQYCHLAASKGDDNIT